MRGLHNFIQDLKNHLPALSLLLSIPLLNMSYPLLNNGARQVHSLVTDFDTTIPFVPAFILPYIFWYPFIFAALFYVCVKDKTTYYRTVLTFDVGLVLCYSVYYMYQTTVPRPDVIGDGMLFDLVRRVYHWDQPYNCFPSIHVLTSYLIMRAVGSCPNVSRRVSYPTFLIGATIIVSTLFVKQHVLLDVASAILISELAYSLIGMFMLNIRGERSANWRKKPYPTEKEIEGSAD
jgi:membrane-associated phospholipid phosphatase